jgi:regulation of enolase protein 1 (concanavalin A-like superfamily)
VREQSNGIEASSLFMPKSSRVYFHRRTAPGGSTTTSFAGAAAAPYWVRLVRAGSTLTASMSADGTNWTQVGSASINMADPVQVGLAVTSGTTSSTLTATIDNVTVSQP